LHFQLLKKTRRDGDRNDVVEGVSAGTNSEAADCKQGRKIHSRDGPKNKLRQVERVLGIRAAGYKIYVVMRAEQRRRNDNGKYDRVLVRESQDVLKQQHQNAD